MKTKPLTTHSLKIFWAILKYKASHDGCSPAFADLMEICDAASKSTIKHHLAQLAAAGRIRTPAHNKARSIEVIGGRWSWTPITTGKSRQTLGETVKRLEDDKIRANEHLALLLDFLTTNFPEAVDVGLSRDANVVEIIVKATLLVLEELKERREMSPAPESQHAHRRRLGEKGGRPAGPRPRITPSKPRRDKHGDA